MSSPLIELKNVSKIYQELPFSGIKGIDLSISKGSVTVIAGESGSGKSTLLKVINGLMSPDEGVVLFDGERVRGPEQRLIPGHDEMKVVAQDFDLNIYAKAFDNIASLLPNTDLKRKHQKTFEIMEFLRIAHLAEKRAFDLSGGEQQRVAIARAVITRPQVILMDEPFSQIDSLVKNDLRADIRRMARELGITILIVSHDPVDGLSLADQMIILRGGSIVETGSPLNLYNNPGSLYTAQLLSGCTVLSAENAEKIGIRTAKSQVAIYAEWVAVNKGDTTSSFVIKDKFFKGFYEELLLEKNGVQVRALHSRSDNYEKDVRVSVEFKRILEF